MTLDEDDRLLSEEEKIELVKELKALGLPERLILARKKFGDKALRAYLEQEGLDWEFALYLMREEELIDLEELGL